LLIRGSAGTATRKRILGFQMQPLQIRQHAQYRLAGFALQPLQPGLQQADVAAKPVDDEPFDALAFAGRQQRQGPDQMGEHAAAIDVGDQQHRTIHRFGIAHVGDVVGAQIDLGRAAGAFNYHRFEQIGQALMRGQHRFHRHAFVVVVGARIQVGDDAAVHDHLRAGIAVGLEQDRIEIGMRR
jgi:hypothetical protein